MSIEAQELLRDDLEIKTVLVSVYEKRGLTEFAETLQDFHSSKNSKIRFIATGGTYAKMQEAGIQVTQLTDVAPFPEILDGRVKTLQPQVFGGILANKARPGHLGHLKDKGISTIDMVICNFYPFEEVAAKEGSTVAQMVKNIDIGGPSLIRAAAKNFGSVCVVPSPLDYKDLAREIMENDGKVSYQTRVRLAVDAFSVVAHYDNAIKEKLSKSLGKDESTRPMQKVPHKSVY